MGSDITHVITTVGRPRRGKLIRAFESVCDQELMPDFVVVAFDNDRRGAPFNRQGGTDHVRTTYVSYQDDDDELMPHHLRVLHERIIAPDRPDLVFPHFTVINGSDPFARYEGVPWDDDNPRQVPVTFLARTEAIRAANGWLTDWTTVAQAEDPGTDADGNRSGEDFQLVKRLIANGAKIVHLPERTWKWWHGGNYMGLPSRVNWDSVD